MKYAIIILWEFMVILSSWNIGNIINRCTYHFCRKDGGSIMLGNFLWLLATKLSNYWDISSVIIPIKYKFLRFWIFYGRRRSIRWNNINGTVNAVKETSRVSGTTKRATGLENAHRVRENAHRIRENAHRLRKDDR